MGGWTVRMGRSGRGLKHLHRLTRLRELYLDQTKVTKTGVEELSKVLPQASISQSEQE